MSVEILRNRSLPQYAGANLLLRSIEILSSVKATVDYTGNKSLNDVYNSAHKYSIGSTFNFNIFDLTYAYSYNTETYEKKQLLSATFSLKTYKNH